MSFSLHLLGVVTSRNNRVGNHSGNRAGLACTAFIVARGPKGGKRKVRAERSTPAESCLGRSMPARPSAANKAQHAASADSDSILSPRQPMKCATPIHKASLSIGEAGAFGLFFGRPWPIWGQVAPANAFRHEKPFPYVPKALIICMIHTWSGGLAGAIRTSDGVGSHGRAFPATHPAALSRRVYAQKPRTSQTDRTGAPDVP